ncbi:hypothetical protein [Synechococcus sp. CBW1108]|nr:hypothetical protein [Synechococcus sp. CBW1108]QPN69406.1 hypothetical protein H8F27_12605 [Synechococcus sp. CBW1108]
MRWARGLLAVLAPGCLVGLQRFAVPRGGLNAPEVRNVLHQDGELVVLV